jgi:hypothetical protein
LESASEIALLVGCFLVVAGLFFEDWVATFRISGEIAVIVGVMLEGLADGGIFLAAGRLRLIQDAELERMRLETAQANERAEASTHAAEKAKRDVAEANLEVARLNLEIEKPKAPRALTPNQETDLIARLNLPHTADRFHEMGTNITVDNDDQEARNLAEQITRILRLANWDPRESPNTDRRAITGVVIEVDTEWREKLADPATKLASAFREEGLTVSGPNAVRFGDIYPLIRVMIGRKP